MIPTRTPLRRGPSRGAVALGGRPCRQLPGREWLWAPAALPAAAAAAGPGEGEAGEAGVAVGPPGLYLLLASVCARVADDAPRGKMEGCAQLLVNGTVCSLASPLP